MSNEMIVQSGAANAAVKVKHDSARVSVGKIARLPKEIREEFNRRLEDGQPASEILPWVNALPVTITILAKYFNDVPISEKNLSEWRQKGFLRWQEKQDSMAELKWLAEDAEDFSDATGGNVARIAVMKIIKMLQAIPATPDSIDALAKISYAVSALSNTDQNKTRLEYEKTRVYQGNERLVLSWEKFLRSRVETAQRALENAICKDIQAADIDNGEKIELLGHELFGRKWKGRVMGRKAEGSKNESAEPEKAGAQTADQQVRPTTEAVISPVEEKAEGKETDTHIPVEMNITGSLTTAATTPVAPPNPKQKPAAQDVQPAPVKNVQPKPQEDPSVPKPSPWDSFSEPVQPSPVASFFGAMRPESWKNKLG